MSTDNKFEWNDAAVKEMIYSKLPIPEHYCGDLQKCLDEFKQSKKEQSLPERITIGAVCLIQSHGELGGGDYGFYYPKKLPQDKFPAIKQAIENCLNSKEGEITYSKSYVDSLKLDLEALRLIHEAYRLVKDKKYTQQEVDAIKCQVWCAGKYGKQKTYTEFFEAEIKSDNPPSTSTKEWEIVSFKSHNNQDNPYNWWYLKENGKYSCSEYAQEFTLDTMLHKDNCVDNGRILIHSVRRLTDGCVFTIGDKVEDKIVKGSKKICGFRIDGNDLIVDFATHGKFIKQIKHSTPTPQEQDKSVLFITEDGVGVTNTNDTVWKVEKTTYELEQSNACHVKNNTTYIKTGFLVFSTKEAAEQYIKWNKPQYSLAHILANSEYLQQQNCISWYKFNIEKLSK